MRHACAQSLFRSECHDAAVAVGDLETVEDNEIVDVRRDNDSYK